MSYFHKDTTIKDKHNLSSEILTEKTKDSNETDSETKPALLDTRCGIGCFYPNWLQFFASKKTFVIVYSLAGMQILLMSSYYTGTLSTVEKNFHMSSKMSGLISAAWDISSLAANLILAYVSAKGHRTRWIALGMLIVSVSSFMRTIPYHIYKGGDTIKLYTKEYETESGIMMNYTKSDLGNSTGIRHIHTNINCGFNDTVASSSDGDSLGFYTFVVAQALMGLGSSVYWTCGVVYLDDNARKNAIPILLAISHVLKMLGPIIGFILSAYTLKTYVNPDLTPIISSDDPRWVGAWWIGWYPIGIFGLINAVAMSLFPKMLPRAAMRKAAEPSTPTEKNEVLSASDFMETVKRICKNKVVVYNSLSSVSFMIGLMAVWTFMPKYMESQFRLSPSQSNALTGTVAIASSGVGILSSGFVISKYKPSPRFLAGWNVLVESMDVLGRLAYILLSCPDPTYHGHWNEDKTWGLNETCNANFNCGTDIQYSPVCDTSRDLVFFSSCHAGCTTSTTNITNNKLIFSNCSCVPDADAVVLQGMCPVDCSTKITLLVIMMAVLGFTSATGRAANTLIQFRCVEEKDKAMSIGITETLMAVLALMPGPILYGFLMDWACIVWGDNCGSKGNCWVYDAEKLRYGFNLTSAGFLLIGTILDCFVWYYVKGVKIYDEDFLQDSNEKKEKPVENIVLPIMPVNNDTSK